MTASDDDWAAIKKLAEKGEREFMLQDNLVCRYRGKHREVALVVPKDDLLRKSILEELHSTPLGGHVGVAKLLSLVTKRFWWKELYADAKRFCYECVIC